MSALVVDASAGVQISLDTRRGRALAALISTGAAAWVPEHFFVEVLGGLRRQLLVERVITEDHRCCTRAAAAVAPADRVRPALGGRVLAAPAQHVDG